MHITKLGAASEYNQEIYNGHILTARAILVLLNL